MKPTHLALVITACLASAALAADVPPAAPSPEFQNALKELAAPQFARRQAAGLIIEHLLVSDLRLIIDAQTPAAREHVKALIDFDEGLTHWALEILKLPPEDRKSLIAWGLAPQNVPLVAKAFSGSSQQRIEGAKAMAAIKGDEPASFVLAFLLDDDDRDVHLAAMESAWERQPTEAIVDALWRRSIATLWNLYFPRPEQQAARLIINNGMAINFDNPSRHAEDAESATETLIHFQSPLVQERIRKLFQQMQRDLDGRPNGPLAMTSIFQTEPGKQLFCLLEAYRTPETIAVLAKFADQPIQYRQQQNVQGKAFFMSNRTPTIAILALLCGLDQAEFRLSKFDILANSWAFASENDETAALERLKKILAEKAAGNTAPALAGTSPPARVVVPGQTIEAPSPRTTLPEK